MRLKEHVIEISKHGIIYTISNFLTKAAGILLIPVYTRFLDTSEYGIVANIVAIISFFTILYTFGMEAAWGRLFFDYEDRSDSQKILLANILGFLFIFGLIISLVITFFGEKLFKYAIPDLDFAPYIILGIWTAFFGLFFNLKNSLFRVRQQSIHFGLFNFSRFVATVVVTIIAIVIYKYGAIGKIGAEFGVWFLFFLIAIFLLKKDIKIKYDSAKLKGALKYAIGILPHSLSGSLINVVDRLIITNVKGLSDAGIYTVGAQFGSVMFIITHSINLSWSPFFMKLAKDLGNDAKEIFSRLTTYYAFALYFIGLMIIFFSSEAITLLTTNRYYDALLVIPIYISTYIINGLYFMMSTKIFYIKKAVKYLSLATFSSAAVNILLNVILIPIYGITGAAWARFFSTIVLLIITYLISQKYYYIKYEYSRLTILTIVALLLMFVFQIIQDIPNLNSLEMLCLKTLLLCSYFILIYLLKFFIPGELKTILSLIKKYK